MELEPVPPISKQHPPRQVPGRKVFTRVLALRAVVGGTSRHHPITHGGERMDLLLPVIAVTD